MLRNRVNRVNRVLLTIGVGAAVCAFPVALAAARAAGDPRASAQATTQVRVVLAAGTAARQGAPAQDAPAGAGGAAGASARPGVRAAPQILFPIPSQGPPRQFPLGPSPSPSPTPPPTTPPPPRPAPAPARPKPAAKPAPKPVVVKPAPKPTPKPPPKPVPKPTLPPPLPPTRYHAVPRRRLTPVLVVFLVAIVPISLARVRR